MEVMGRISLWCVVGTDSSTLVTWIKDGHLLQGSEEVLIQVTSTVADPTQKVEMILTSTLTLIAVSAEDSGQYWCRANNSLVAREMESKYQLTVQDSPLTPGKQLNLSELGHRDT